MNVLSLVLELGIELLNRANKIKEDVALVTNGQKDLSCYVTKSLENMQHQISGKGITLDSSKNSANRPRSNVGQQSPLYGTCS